MNKPLALMALCAGALALGACNKTPTPAASAMADKPVLTETRAPAEPVPGSSLPSSAIYPPMNAASSASTSMATDGTRKPSEGATPTPKPGQNNDHSAPLAPAKPVSARD